jgi:hypothetical protein
MCLACELEALRYGEYGEEESLAALNQTARAGALPVGPEPQRGRARRDLRFPAQPLSSSRRFLCEATE